MPGWDPESSAAAIGLARVDERIGAAAGVHPHEARNVDAGGWTRIVGLAKSPRVVAVGETGLDYDRLHSPRATQLDNLRRHLILGVELDKPVIVHCRSAPGRRDAQDDLLAELERLPAVRPVLHSYSGPPDYASACARYGAVVSVSGLSFRRGEEATAEVARLLSGDRLLVETDAPYLPPPGVDRRRNEPQWVAVTARWVAERRGEEPSPFGERLVATYDRVFRER